ncbi:MAG: hypothetical protein HZB92_02525, partial [Euryarchaeota archaeon]|nr:hypothetical protein [Euryarchaeota archaeon]
MARSAVKYSTVSGQSEEISFLGFIGEQRDAIRNRVFDFLPRVESGSMVAEHSEMVRDYPERGGKYVRPGLVLLSCAASGVDI